MPKFELEEIEDWYVYYVHILEISEELFWNSQWSFLVTVAENKNAYENWKLYVLDKERERK